MEINIHGDKIKITGAMKDYIEEKLGRLEKYLEDSDNIRANVIAKVNGHNSVAGNEYADALATNNTKKLDEWYDKMLEI